MDQRIFDAAQQGLMASLVGTEQESNLQRFLEGLRSDPAWGRLEVAGVEDRIRTSLGLLTKRDEAMSFRPKLRMYG